MKATLWFDGCCLPYNPGGTACGGYVLKIKGKRDICEARVISESGTNNQGEYGGFIMGLERALSEGVADLQVFGDSKLVVCQVNGDWEVRSESIVDLWKKAVELADKFKSLSLCWISREKNGDADKVVHGEWLRAYEGDRREKAKGIKDEDIRDLGGGKFEVKGRKVYKVDVEKRKCTCPDFVRRNKGFLLARSGLVVRCKHLIAVEVVRNLGNC